MGEILDLFQWPVGFALELREDPVRRHVVPSVVADEGLDPRLGLQEEAEVGLLHGDADPLRLVGRRDAVEAESGHLQLLPEAENKVFALQEIIT